MAASVAHADPPRPRLAEEVFGLGRRRAAAPGPSSAVTKRPRPRTIAAGTPLVLSRTRSAAAAASSAIAITVASSSRPSASSAAAPVVERRPGRRSRSPPRPGPGARRARSCRRRRRRPRRRRPRRSRPGSGGRRRRGPPAAGRRCRARAGSSCRCRRWRRRSRGGLDDQDAALGPQHLAALGEDQLDQGRLLAEDGGKPACLGAGHDRGEPADPALGLGDDLLGDDDDVAVGELGSARRSARRPSSPRRPPAGRDRDDPQLPGAAAHIPSALAVRPARAPARLQLAGRARSGRPGCRGRARARRAPRPRRGCRPRGRRRRGGAQLPSPKAGTIALGGLSTRALVPVPWRSGTIPT